MSTQVKYSFAQEIMLRELYGEIRLGCKINIIESDSFDYVEKNNKYSVLVNYLTKKGVIFRTNKNYGDKVNKNVLRIYEEEYIIILEIMGNYVYIMPVDDTIRTVYYNWASGLFKNVDIVGDYGLIRIDISDLK